MMGELASLCVSSVISWREIKMGVCCPLWGFRVWFLAKSLGVFVVWIHRVMGYDGLLRT